MAKWQIIQETGKTNWYVSKDGNDTTGSGTTTAPYATINKARQVTTANNQKIVIGSGIWKETLAASSYVNDFIGEQGAVLDGSTADYVSFKNNDTATNITFQNYTVNCVYIATDLRGLIIQNCVFNNCNMYANSCPKHTKNVFYNCTFSCGSTQIEMYYDGCYFKNTIGAATKNTDVCTKVKNCIINSPEMKFAYDTTNFNYNNIIGTVKWATVARDLEWLTGNTLTNQQSISTDPLLNDPLHGNFTLQDGSPCLYAGENRAHIGPYGKGYNYNGLNDAFLEASGATWSNVAVDENGVFYQVDALLDATIETTMITLPNIIKVSKIHLFKSFAYDIPTQHYDFLIKYGATEAEYSSASYMPMLYDYSPTVDNSGRGNADEAYVVAEGQMIRLKYFSLKLYMTVL
jgi:hypothetical protein